MDDARSPGDPPGDPQDLRYRALADTTRRHLLRILDDSPEPVALDVLSTRVGLHVNTVRDHLNTLQEAGLISRTSVPRTTPGRPRVAFRAVPREARLPDAEGYRFLAGVLVDSVDDPRESPSSTAREAGRKAGRQLADDSPGHRPASADNAIEQVVSVFAELGFAPESAANEGVTQIRLHDCPFRALAKASTDVVCSVHEGLLMGMLEAMGSSLSVDELQPFAEPSLCVARLSSR